MSLQATSWVLDFSESRGAARLVLICFSHWINNETFEAFRSNSTLCRESKLSERGVRQALLDLQAIKELVWSGRLSDQGVRIYLMPRFRDWYLQAQKLGTKTAALSAPGIKCPPATNAARGANNAEKAALSAPDLVVDLYDKKKEGGPPPSNGHKTKTKIQKLRAAQDRKANAEAALKSPVLRGKRRERAEEILAAVTAEIQELRHA